MVERLTFFFVGCEFVEHGGVADSDGGFLGCDVVLDVHEGGWLVVE